MPSTTTTNDYNNAKIKALVSVPKDYYIKLKEPIARTYPNLKEAIMGGVLKTYTLNKYDCSEMSAYTEWKLENLGFNVKICIADNFMDSGSGHAWIKVDLDHANPCYIEATAMTNTIGVKNGTIIRGNDRDILYYELYSSYDHIYDDIYEVMADRSATASDFDWWNSVNFSDVNRTLRAKIKQHVATPP